jgi:hypothetical protein
VSTAQERAQDVVLQYREGGLTVSLEYLITVAIRDAEARGLREARLEANRRVEIYDGRVEGCDGDEWVRYNDIIDELSSFMNWCEAQAKEREA